LTTLVIESGGFDKEVRCEVLHYFSAACAACIVFVEHYEKARIRSQMLD
jgi:hypothetical protein